MDIVSFPEFQKIEQFLKDRSYSATLTVRGIMDEKRRERGGPHGLDRKAPFLSYSMTGLRDRSF